MKSLTDLAGDLSASTAQVLTALRIIATRADVEEIVAWTQKELEGYSTDDDLPAHRTWKLTIKASLHNPWHGFAQEIHVSDLAIKEELREQATTFRCRDGVWQIEHMLSVQGDRRLAAEHPNLAMMITTGPLLGEGWVCTHANAEFSTVHLADVVNKARQTALGFCLACEKEGVDLRWGEDDPTAPEERANWLSMIREEGTKLVLQSAWKVAEKIFTGEG